MFKTPILMLKMKFFWLIFRGKFEQKTQKSIFLKNQWRLKNIKKAMVVKNIIAEDMPFTKSIFEQFWRSYCKKTIFVVFHFLKFLPTCHGSWILTCLKQDCSKKQLAITFFSVLVHGIPSISAWISIHQNSQKFFCAKTSIGH